MKIEFLFLNNTLVFFCSLHFFQVAHSATTDPPPPIIQRPILSRSCFSLQDALKHNIDVRETTDEIKGLGAFCKAKISAGTWVGEYYGELLTNHQVEARYWKTRKKKVADRRWIKSRTQRKQGMSGDYLFDMGDGIFLDAEDSDVSSWCRFLNHATEDDSQTGVCNLETTLCCGSSRRRQTTTTDNKENDTTIIPPPQLWFVARRDILPGEELLYDYGDSYWSEE